MARKSKEEAWAERISREGRSLGVLLRETLPEIKADIELLRDKQTDAFYKLPESDQEGVLGFSKNRSICWLEIAIGDIEACIRNLTNSIE